MTIGANEFLRIALALKPFAEYADEYDANNTYRPLHPASVIVAEEGDAKITLQHCFNAQEVFKGMCS